MKATSLIYYVELYLTLLGASAKKRKKKKRAGFNSLMGALSYWTKQGNISPAGSRAWAPIWTPDASRLPCSERWASSFHNKTHSCSFCSHSHTGHAHTRCLGCTLPLTARRIRSTVVDDPCKRHLTQRSPQTRRKHERLWPLVHLRLKCFLKYCHCYSWVAKCLRTKLAVNQTYFCHCNCCPADVKLFIDVAFFFFLVLCWIP